MRVAIYGRVSTGHQVEHQTIEQQLGRLAEHMQAHAAAWFKKCHFQVTPEALDGFRGGEVGTGARG
jgi:DNA invertase Pin-like site-specific DNA recombinase